MKKVLITGARSFIGTSIEKWLLHWPVDFQVDTIDMVDGSWRKMDFSPYDIVYHVAGIAHVSSKKKMAPLYFMVNRDLAIETAKKAKADGVKQFIFMSSMIIYGPDTKIGDFRPINPTNYRPINAYGRSKLDADLAIQQLGSETFRTAVIRSPVVYGEGSKGNYPKLLRVAKIFPIFPNIDNKKSMINIINLCQFVKAIIVNNENGVFYPQDKRYSSTREILMFERMRLGKRYRETKIFNWLIKILSVFFPIINKMYGNKFYTMQISNYKEDYWIY